MVKINFLNFYTILMDYFIINFYNFLDFLEFYENLENIGKIMFSAFLGIIVGVERKHYDKPVGYRTCLIITTSATLLTIFSIEGFSPFMSEGGINDPSRLSAQILSGIGFIGAGVIIHNKEKRSIQGLTTAATIWILTAIGIGVGIGEYLLSFVVTVILFITLFSKISNIKNKK